MFCVYCSIFLSPLNLIFEYSKFFKIKSVGTTNIENILYMVNGSTGQKNQGFCDDVRA